MAPPRKSTPARWNRLNRQQRRALRGKLRSADPGLTIVHPNAAGIDIGNESHFAAVPADRDPQPVQQFGCWTSELRRLANWLLSCQIDTVAVQATGVYWFALYDVLTAHGLRVTVVNAVHTKNVPGRKTDVQECQWLMKLHAYGLLNDSFHTPRSVEKVRTVWRIRDRHVKEASRAIQHMQKALTAMNVQLSNTLSDLSGLSGQAIIRAILNGERDPYRLADLCHARVQATREEVARSLEGNWRDEVLFELQQAVDSYDFTQRQLQACDEQLQQYLAELPTHPLAAPAASSAAGAEPGNKPKRARRSVGQKKARGNAPQFDLRAELTRIAGVDLTSIDGIEVMTAQTILAELGPDLSAFPTEDHFASWLGLCPRKDISGGRVIGTARTKVRNRVAIAFRNAAMTLKQSKSFLGARYRHLQMKLPSKTAATKAMGRYLAILVYRLMRNGQAWVDRGMERFEAKREEREMASLASKAKARGFQLIPIASK